MEFLFYFFIFVFGAAIGSFLNVVIFRHNTGFTLGGRSFCFSCSKELSWKDLFPVASYLLLGGKCRYCKSKIAYQYTLVEAATGFLAMLLFQKAGGLLAFEERFLFGGVDPSWVLGILFAFVVMGLLVVIAVYDLKHKIIPDIFSYSFAAVAFVQIFVLPEAVPGGMIVWNFFAGPILALPFALIWLFSRGRLMGLGDAKLTLGIGWFLGLKAGFIALVLSFWIGAAFGLALILVGKLMESTFKKSPVSMKSELPFAPFLILGLLIVYFCPAVMSAASSFLSMN